MPHPQQLSPDDISLALTESSYPALLLDLLKTSEKYFGVRWRHFPHTINYTWIAAGLSDLSEGARVLEIGAGANPLPFYLADRGVTVDTVDNSDVPRRLPPDESWNEWGFLDYGLLHPSITSYNLSVTDFEPGEKYDAIYSVSVLSHMPSPLRKAMLKRCRDWLKPGCRLMKAIDLIPNTDWLWNKGGSNETPEQHGTFQTVEGELNSLGFAISESRTQRNVRKSRTDLHFLTANT